MMEAILCVMCPQVEEVIQEEEAAITLAVVTVVKMLTALVGMWVPQTTVVTNTTCHSHLLVLSEFLQARLNLKTRKIIDCHFQKLNFGISLQGPLQVLQILLQRPLQLLNSK